MQNIPKTTKGVITQPDGTVSYSEMPIPELTEDQILVKVHSSPIHSLDYKMITGAFRDSRPKPRAGGLEGSGLVVATGSSEQAKALLNKRVAFSAYEAGAWVDYCVVPAKIVAPLPEHTDYEQGSMILANPLSVQALLNKCEVNNYTAIANSAAASQVGRMLLKVAQEAGITVVNFVRREEQVKILKDLGAEHIINRGEEGWEEKAEKVLAEQKVQVYFDALAGPDGGKILHLLPDNTDVYCYGKLTGKDIAFDVVELMTRHLTIKGYDIADDMADPETAAKLLQGAYKNIEKGNYKSTIKAKYTYDRFEEALKASTSDATKGKVLHQTPTSKVTGLKLFLHL